MEMDTRSPNRGSWNQDDPSRPKWVEGVTKEISKHDYYGPDGKYSYTIRKGLNEKEGEKAFQTRRTNTIPDGDRINPEDKPDYFYDMGDQKPVLYRLPELMDARAKANGDGWLVLGVEGEKDVETAEGLGFVATTNPFGAGIGKWHDDFSPCLKGADFVSIPDKDDIGREHADRICASVSKYARSVTRFEMPDGFKDLSEWKEDQDAKGLSIGTIKANLALRIKDHFGNVKPVVDPLNRSDDVMSLADFIKRDLPPPDYISGNWLTTTSRTLLYAPTGIGKTMFCLGLAIAMAAGKPFLHWKATRPVRVLYIDGEMSRRVMQERAVDECKRCGVDPSAVSMWVISQEDIVNDMPPLNTPAGQAFVEEKIKKIGGVDCVFFDNIMHLLIGDPKDTEPWRVKSHSTPTPSRFQE